MKKEIVVQGAGLSGLSSALLLAREGLNVSVYEKSSSIGGAIDADVRSFKNYSLKEDWLDELKSQYGVILENHFPVHEIIYVSPSQKSYKIFSSTRPLFHNVLRGKAKGSIDSELYQIAIDNGVKFHFNAQPEMPDIIASGSTKKDGWAYGYHFKNIRISSNYIFQDENVAPHGYIYILPYKDDQASLVATSFIKGFDLKKSLDRFIEKNELVHELLKNSEKVNEIRGSGGYNIPMSAFVDGRYYVGEAAGFVDAARGFGMYYAMKSGFLAAKSIIENKNYDKAWKDEFKKELFSRFARRQYMNYLSNEEHDKMAEKIIKQFGDEVPIERYQNRKKSSWYKIFMLNLFSNLKLMIWRKEHRPK